MLPTKIYIQWTTWTENLREKNKSLQTQNIVLHFTFKRLINKDGFTIFVDLNLTNKPIRTMNNDQLEKTELKEMESLFNSQI